MAIRKIEQTIDILAGELDDWKTFQHHTGGTVDVGTYEWAPYVIYLPVVMD